MESAPSEKSTPPLRSSELGSPNERVPVSADERRWIWLVVSAFCLAADTFFAFLQPPRPNSLASLQDARSEPFRPEQTEGVAPLGRH
jgi:hypothetical protein